MIEFVSTNKKLEDTLIKVITRIDIHQDAVRLNLIAYGISRCVVYITKEGKLVRPILSQKDANKIGIQLNKDNRIILEE